MSMPDSVPALLIAHGSLLAADWFPAQHGLARGGSLIQPRYAGGMWGVQHGLGIFLDFFGDRLHGFDEQIHLFFGFALGRLDHERAGHNQRKRGGIGMEAVVD